MRRGLTVLVVLSVCLLQAQALAFHVHAVPDHAEDRDHHHGPAIHHHDDLDRVPHVKAEDVSESGTIITIAVPVATVSVALVIDAEFAQALRAPELQLIGRTRAIVVRSHGPPPARNSFLRGPPTSPFL